MVENHSSQDGGSRRKTLLAVVLLLLMSVLVGRSLYFLWQEGDGLCRVLQSGLLAVPTSDMPCAKTSYAVGATDWMSAYATGSGVERSVVRYQYGESGHLIRLDSDRNDDGSVELTYDCSMIGKILMPITNYAAWSSYSTITELSKRATSSSARQTISRGETTGVSGLSTRLTVPADESFSTSPAVTAATHDEYDRLRREVRQTRVPGMLSMSNYEYNSGGNLSSHRQTTISHPYAFVRQTDYKYKCRD